MRQVLTDYLRVSLVLIVIKTKVHSKRIIWMCLCSLEAAWLQRCVEPTHRTSGAAAELQRSNCTATATKCHVSEIVYSFVRY